MSTKKDLFATTTAWQKIFFLWTHCRNSFFLGHYRHRHIHTKMSETYPKLVPQPLLNGYKDFTAPFAFAPSLSFALFPLCFLPPCKCSWWPGALCRCPPPSRCLCCQVGRRMSGEADIGEERIPAEDMLSVPTDCKSGTYKDKRSVDSGGSGTALCWSASSSSQHLDRVSFTFLSPIFRIYVLTSRNCQKR